MYTTKKAFAIILFAIFSSITCFAQSACDKSKFYSEYSVKEMISAKKLFFVSWWSTADSQHDFGHVRVVFHQYDSSGNHIGEIEKDSIPQGFTGIFQAEDNTSVIKIQVFHDWTDSEKNKKGYNGWVNKLFKVEGQHTPIFVDPTRAVVPIEPEEGGWFLQKEEDEIKNKIPRYDINK